MQIAVLFAALGRFEASVTKAAELTFENSPPLPPELIHHGAAHQQLVLLLPSERYSCQKASNNYMRFRNASSHRPTAGVPRRPAKAR